MRKYLSILACLILYPSMAFAVSEPYSSFITSTATVGSSIPTSSLFAVTSGGTTYSATASQVASMAGGGGVGFSVAAYVAAAGGACDGGSIAAGIGVTTGSPNINLPTNTGQAGYPQSWGQMAAGDTIVLSNPAMIDSTAVPTANQILTVVSLSNTTSGSSAATAVVSGNATFTSSGFPGASARYYNSVNTTAVQTAINAAFATGVGGNVNFPQGLCAVTGPITFYSNVQLIGSGRATSGIMLANGSNSDIMKGFQFSSLTGTQSFGGTVGWGMYHIGFDGNMGANTGSGQGTQNGTGDGIRFYGAACGVDDIAISNVAGDGIYSEWNDGAGDPENTQFPLECQFRHIWITQTGGFGWVYNGPHDGEIWNADITNTHMSGMRQYGFDELTTHGNGAPLVISDSHWYQTGSSGFYTMDSTAGLRVVNTIFEGDVLFRNFSYNFTNVDVTHNLYLSPTTTSAGIYDLHMDDVGIGNQLINNNSAGNSTDVWTGGYLNGGVVNNASTPYLPAYSFGVAGSNGYGNNKADAFGGINLTGQAAESISMGRVCCSFNQAGSNLTINAGGSTKALGNSNGGNLILSSGISTGTGISNILLKAFAASTSGTTDNTASTIATVSASGLALNGNLSLTLTGTLPTNGLYLSSPNTLSFTTSGANALNISTTGFVGIGTTNPLQALDVRGLAAFNAPLSNGTPVVPTGCGSVTPVGGLGMGSFAAGQTSCAAVWTGLPTAPNGWSCSLKDISTPADGLTQSAKTTTGCMVSGTVTNGDTLIYHLEAF
jgi:hypothetical protein